MNQNINFIILNLLLVILTSSCQKQYNAESFEIDLSATNTVKTNDYCLRIFEKIYGIDSLKLKKYRYVEGIINRFIVDNKGQKQERLLYIRIDKEGEVYETTSLGMRVIKDNDVVVTRYDWKDKQPAPVHKKLKQFGMKEFDGFLQKNTGVLKRHRRYNVLIFDFKNNNSCKCKFLNNLPNIDIRSIENMSFFDQFLD
ncbi:hypothetical protein ATE84_2899 [Aquimarina sp. MAR_2010_214]|uniref:hypothetical protein n=1 Tax=Aquimarina sp. MAR_2010_214 TaxID=1250026 RepID=UPI000C70B7E2|nr:hypothetical protein [Aquimarina sp. MAR_2010_214]PKV50832.1 hypothetical protein ATE84_2899 [Aquimarina sp. MAR_2010_214]